MEKKSNIREFSVSRDRLVVHPAVKEIFELSGTIECEVDYQKISDEYFGFQQFSAPLLVEKLEPNFYGFYANWGYLRGQYAENIYCRVFPQKIREEVIRQIALTSLVSQFVWMPKLSCALAPLVRVTRKFPEYLKDIDLNTARANFSIERAVAGIVQSDLSTVRSHVRSERERREKYEAQAHEILRGIIRQ